MRRVLLAVCLERPRQNRLRDSFFEHRLVTPIASALSTSTLQGRFKRSPPEKRDRRCALLDQNIMPISSNSIMQYERCMKASFPIFLLIALFPLLYSPKLYSLVIYANELHHTSQLRESCILPVLDERNPFYTIYRIEVENQNCSGTVNGSIWKLPENFSYIVPKQDKIEWSQAAVELTSWSRLNVYVICLEGLSSSTVQYNLQKSHDYITKTLDAVILKGYNVVGEGNLQSLMPILTGKKSEEDSIIGQSASQYYNPSPTTIFDDFSKHGYVTMFAEDNKDTVFPYNDLQRQSIDHLMQGDILHVLQDRDNVTENNCTDNISTLQAWFRYSEDFFTKYPSNAGKMAMMHLSQFLRNDINLADFELSEHLRRMESLGGLNNTLLIILATSGASFVQLSRTLQGQLEKRMPFVALYLPPEFRLTGGRQAWQNLNTNAHRMTTPLDIYSTLMDAISFPTNRQMSMLSDRTSRSLSLFRSVPSDRTCAEARIPPEHCVCHLWQSPVTFRDENNPFDAISNETYATEKPEAVFKVIFEGNMPKQRNRTLLNLTNLIQARIDALQNPVNIHTAAKMICHLDFDTGFGSHMHHAARCLVLGFGLRRTVLFKMGRKNSPRHWLISPTGWSAAFEPISRTGKNYSRWINSNSGTTFVSRLPKALVERNEFYQTVQYIPSDPTFSGSQPQFLPQSFPREFADELLELHGNPPAWFIGQFIYYIMRQSYSLKDRLSLMEERIPFARGPIVGVHIRRTDKITTNEAKLYSVHEYMAWVEDWFAVRSMQIGEQMDKRIFISTDDPAAISEIKEKFEFRILISNKGYKKFAKCPDMKEAIKRYRDYTIYSDENIASSARPDNRYTDESFYGVLIDIFLLSKCDYLVGTFSSKIGRLAYELMQVYRGDVDASAWFHSLDRIYFYDFQPAHEQRAVLPHVPQNDAEIELREGDVIVVQERTWIGYSFGTNQRTGQFGWYPSHKVEENWRVFEFPS